MKTELVRVRDIHKAVLEYLKGLNAGVYCKVLTLEYDQPFTYQVWRARTRKGVLSVMTINGWEVPFEVYVRAST